MVEMLMVGVIVLIAACYSAWVLMPVPARQRLAQKFVPLAGSPACPAWLGRRIRAAASGPATGGGPCDACSTSHPRDDGKR